MIAMNKKRRMATSSSDTVTSEDSEGEGGDIIRSFAEQRR